MLLARVCGHATASIKHPSLAGFRLVLVMPARSKTTEPLLVLDRLGVAPGDWVMITSDGKGARELVGTSETPARWVVMGRADETPAAVREAVTG
jgi:ethanolamine utilization protein EutN